ncbi:MAG: hypothetical protein V3V62_10820 [bacterium]
MSAEPPRLDVFLSYLKKQIEEREDFRSDVERSIHILRQAEEELRRQRFGAAPPLDDDSEDLPYRIHSGEGETSSARSEMFSFAEEPPEPPPAPPREAEPDMASGLLDKSAAAGNAHQKQIEDFLEEGQHLLLDIEGRDRETVPPPAPPPSAARTPAGREGGEPPLLDEVELEEEIPLSPVPASRAASPARPGAATPQGPLTATQRLKAHVRAGGAIRCLDPWNQLCAAFVLRETEGPAVLATDALLGYLWKQMRRIHRSLQAGASADSREMDERKEFLCAFVGAVMGQGFEAMERVPGLQLASGEARPSEFEFERATVTMLHPRILEYIHNLLKTPGPDFFKADGAYTEIADYLNQFLEFSRSNSEEERTASLLAQIGIAHEPPPGAGKADGEAPKADAEESFAASADSASFLEEAENLQDLNEFDYMPDDVKSILSVKEDALSTSTFKKRAEDFKTGAPESGAGEGEEETVDLTEVDFKDPGQFDLNSVEQRIAAEEAGGEEVPSDDSLDLMSEDEESVAAPPFDPGADEEDPPPEATKAEDAEMKKFLKDIGVDWNT